MALRGTSATCTMCVLFLFFVLKGSSSEEDSEIFSPFWMYRGSCLANCSQAHPDNKSSCATSSYCPEKVEEYEHICNTIGCQVVESCEENPQLVLNSYRGEFPTLAVSWKSPQGNPYSNGVIIYDTNNTTTTEFEPILSLQISDYPLPDIVLSYFTYADCGLVWSQKVLSCDNIDIDYRIHNDSVEIWVLKEFAPLVTRLFGNLQCYSDDGTKSGAYTINNKGNATGEASLVNHNGPVNCSATLILIGDHCHSQVKLSVSSSKNVATQQDTFDFIFDVVINQNGSHLSVSWPDCLSKSNKVKSTYLHWGIPQHGPHPENHFKDGEFKELPPNATSVVLEDLRFDVAYGFQVFCIYDESAIDFIRTGYMKMRYHNYTLENPFPERLPSSSEEQTSSLYYALGFVGGVLFIILALMLSVLAVICYRNRSTKDKVRRTEQSIQNVYDDHPSRNTSRNTSRKSSITSDHLTLSDFHKSVMLADHWEFDPKRLRLGSSMGKGAFGQVVEGFLEGRVCVRQCLKSGWEWVPQDTGKKDVTRVAVKLLKDFASDAQKQEFLQEIQMMKYLGYHPNVVCLIGCCSVMDPVCLVVEACPLGDLKKYLLSSRDKILTRLKEDNLEIDDLLTSADLLSFARQITMGMEYLSQKGYVHRDLAARNVLVSEDKSMKIADFGLTRYIYEDKQYIGKKGARIPVKWMSIEAIIDGVYTTESDVWSFGVILYEIITLGGEPYPGIVNRDLAKMLCNGFRMERPEACPDDLYTMMLDCWHETPKQRPSFTKLRLQLEAMLEQDTPYLSLYPSHAHIFRCLDDIQEEGDGQSPSREDEPLLEEGSVKTEGSRQPSPLSLVISQSGSKLDQVDSDSKDSMLEGQMEDKVRTKPVDSSPENLKNSFLSGEYINAGRQLNKDSEVVLSLLSSPDSCDSGVAIDSRFLYDSKGQLLEYEGSEQMV